MPEPVVIPEKIYFKIGEVCDILDVQAHVLRYWETEFPQLAPQKNRSGQRSYRRRDVEISLRIKELLYEELYTIAGARKKLQSEIKENGKTKSDASSEIGTSSSSDPALFDLEMPEGLSTGPMAVEGLSREGLDALKTLGAQLLELREMLKTDQTEKAAHHLRNQ